MLMTAPTIASRLFVPLQVAVGARYRLSPKSRKDLAATWVKPVVQPFAISTGG